MTDPKPVPYNSRLPRCELHDLERLWCPHDCPHYGDSFTMTPAEHAIITGHVTHIRDLETTIGRRLVEWRFTPRTNEKWAEPNPEKITCRGEDHARPPGAQLCPQCDDALDRLLGDVPAMVEALEQARIKDQRFQPRAITADPDESPTPHNEAATIRLQRLHDALGGHPIRRSRWMLANPHAYDRRTVLADLSWAMAGAHHLIERPDDRMYIGRCPRCTTRDLHASRGHDVVCECGYHQTWDKHLGDQLAQQMDRLFTVSELATATNLPRDTIKNLTRRMTGQKITRPHLDGWVIRTAEVTMYRLGDVLAEHERREAKRSARKTKKPA